VVADAATGVVLRSGRALHPEGTEVDPEAWWVALNSAIADAGGLADVAAISICGQQHGMIVLVHKGRVIRDALLWNDTRSAAAAAALDLEFLDLVQRTGSRPVASFTSTKLRWLRDAEPENVSLIAAIALPHDWLTWRIRGFGPENPRLDELTTDRSEASGTGYWNPTSGEYDLEVLTAAIGTSGITLPRVLAPDDSAGHLDFDPELPNILVGVGAGDNAGAALGLGAQEGDVIVSIGTSGTVFALAPSPFCDTTGTVAGFADASGLFLPLVATLNAARVLDSVAGLLGVDLHTLGQLALQAKPGADGLVLKPYFEGERTPNLPNATGTLFGLTLSSTNRTNLARATIEGLLCGLAGGLDALRDQGLEPRRILLIGGAAQNPAIAAIAAQVFQEPVVVPQPGEYVAIGAAVQAAWALTGTRPAWEVPIFAAPDSDFQPIIRKQYLERRPGTP
jgi:xylulokinase